MQALSRRAVFLDRDGVLNQVVLRNGKPFPPATLEQMEILPGVKEACDSLRASGFLLILVTNQPDIARGTQTRSEVERMNAYIQSSLSLDAVRMCPHDSGDNCGCRKPLPGMLLDAASEFGIDLPASFLVGDRWRDIEAGRNAACRTIWIDAGYDDPRPVAPDNTARNLAEAASWILHVIYREEMQ